MIVIASCTGGGDGHASAKQCEQLREHLIDNQLATATGVEKTAHREALRGALGTDFISRCQQTMTDDQADCALKATDDTALKSCTR